MTDDQLDEIVRALAPEDDGFVAYCDVHLNGRGPYRVHNTARVIDVLLGRVCQQQRPLRIPEYGLTVTYEDDCRVEPVQFTDTERDAYYAAKRSYWQDRSGEHPYPEPPARLVAEHQRILAERAAR